MGFSLRCDRCGFRDENVSVEKFMRHPPCAPDPADVWIVIGRSGRRVFNDERSIKGVIQTVAGHGQPVSVHHGECDFGKTGTDGCTCYPLELRYLRGEVGAGAPARA